MFGQLNNDIFWTKGKHTFQIGTMINFFQLPQLQSKGILGSYGWAGIYVAGPPVTGFLVGIPTTINLVGPGQSVALQSWSSWRYAARSCHTRGISSDKNVIFKTYADFIYRTTGVPLRD